MYRYLKVSFVAAVLLLFGGCGGGSSVVSNTAPIANNLSVTVAAFSTGNVITLAGSDADGDILTYAVTVQPAHGTLRGTAPNLTYTPAADYNGADNFNFKVNDGKADSAPATASITIADKPDPVIKKDITITDDIQVESLGIAKNIYAKVSLGNMPKDLYIVLSNYGTGSAPSTITHNAKIAVSKTYDKADLPQKAFKQPTIIRSPSHIREFNARIKTPLQKQEILKPQAKSVNTARRDDVAGSNQTFYLEIDTSQTTAATARKIVASVSTPFGNKTLNIWVSDDSYGAGCGKSRCVTQEMVDALANNFLQAGSDNDIYDWVVNIYEEEWSSKAQAKYSQLIGEDDEITILIMDIDKDNSPDGGVIGYFYSKDNYKKSSFSGSNERVMFYVDAVMFANGEDGWDIDDFWPKTVISTLSHEFQHMIHFYQKTILLTNNNDTDIWINEMLSETTEDMVATKIRDIGPRGVDYLDGSSGEPDNYLGRYPLFNENNTLSLTSWYDRLSDYSKVSAFGTYLVRNYGGAKLLHDIMHNGYTGEQAIVDAVHQTPNGAEKTFANLQSEWGVAVMLSDHDNLVDQPLYNTGDFTESAYNGIIYQMGSINFFNYNPLPTLYSSSGTVQAQGNYYYKVGENLTGEVTITLDLNGQTEAILIAK